MTGIISTLAFGFLLGMRHALDADHVVAVGAIVARSKRLGTAWLLGVVWGLGHTVTILLVGSAIILFKVAIPARLGSVLESCVGVALVVLGLLNMGGFKLFSSGLTEHSHPHDHEDPEHHHAPDKDGHTHVHAHLDEPELGWLSRHVRDAGRFQLLRSAIVGLVHGLAGSAAVALLVLAAIDDPRAAVGYLLVFGLGTLAGMLTLSALMEVAMVKIVGARTPGDRGLAWATGLISLVFGLYVINENSPWAPR